MKKNTLQMYVDAKLEARALESQRDKLRRLTNGDCENKLSLQQYGEAAAGIAAEAVKRGAFKR